MKRRSPSLVFPAMLLILALLFPAWSAADQPARRIVVFGDSLTDPGNAFVLTHEVSVPPYDLIPSAPYARGGHHFSNGRTWVEQLDRRLPRAHGSCAALQTPRLCSNYAVGGARARPGAPFDLATQVVLFLGDFSGTAQAEALHVMHIGGNDLRDAIEALATDPFGAASVAIIGDALDAIVANIVTLTSAGAREFLVPNAPNFALVPAIRLQGPQAQAAAQALSVAFNNALESVLTGLEASLPVKIHRLNIFALINEAVAMPRKFGLREVEAPCITPGVIVHAECRHPNDFLFWDGIHPTREGHEIIARRAQEMLAQP